MKKFTLKFPFGPLPSGTPLEVVDDKDSSSEFSLGVPGTNILLSPDSDFVREEEKPELIVNKVAFSKVVQKSWDDFHSGKIAFGEKVLCFDISTKSFLTSRLFKDSVHIGRILSGFAMNPDSSPMEKMERLTNLDEAYGLGLTAKEIAKACGFHRKTE